LQVPLPSQLPGQESGSSWLITETQVPPPPVQAWQAPQVAEPQQWPSTQLPEAHSVFNEQVAPLRALQVPAASQVPLQWSSSADITAWQWPVAAQVWQAPVQAPSQQTPSTHWPLAHSSAPVQVAARAFFGVHIPAWQKSPAFGQGFCAEQPPAQMLPAQPLGHEIAGCIEQVPRPSQTERTCAVPAAQLADAHSLAVPG
jgi:hypothetical protein